MLNIISLGAGVQSSTLALMAAAGEISPMPDAAIFADTGWEPAGVYVWLDWLETQLPFPVHRVQHGNIRDDLTRSRVRFVNGELDEGAVDFLRSKNRWVSPPLYTLGVDGNRGMIRRQCTGEYKINPVRKKQRELLGLEKGAKSEAGSMSVWIGISLDEMQRMHDSTDRFSENRWPLIEEKMTRDDCMAWLDKNVQPGGPPVVRSACIGCPFKSNREWRSLTPGEFDDACEVDESLRATYVRTGLEDNKDVRDQVFLHADRVPLREVDLGREYMEKQFSFLDECEGMCGV